MSSEASFSPLCLNTLYTTVFKINMEAVHKDKEHISAATQPSKTN